MTSIRLLTAFIKVPCHQNYGITGTFYSLIQSYLDERHQRVKLVNNDYKSCSSLEIVKHGVLQDSVFGPLSFLLYINDITKTTNTTNNNNKSKLVLFKDNTSLIITSPNPTKRTKDINGAFKYICNWFKAHLLSLNFEKTSLIQFLIKNSSHIPQQCWMC